MKSRVLDVNLDFLPRNAHPADVAQWDRPEVPKLEKDHLERVKSIPVDNSPSHQRQFSDIAGTRESSPDRGDPPVRKVATQHRLWAGTPAGDPLAFQGFSQLQIPNVTFLGIRESE